MDNDYDLNVDEILRTIESAEVVTFRFVVIGQYLLVDNRYNAVDGPLIKTVPRVKSVEEGFRKLKQMRPRFRVPEKICSIWWPKHIQGLVSNGIWDSIVKRLIETGYPGVAQQCEQVFDDLLTLEKEEVRSAILGNGYQAIWECRQDQPQEKP